ncbi:MAG TPA: DUF2892 domain-containing protein [Vicinamibacterales bacterium]|nr:DUF2892 domain-containing protein [Vicinamibacterales bacterium]
MSDRCTVNISDRERWGSLIGGAALTLYGLSRRRRRGWILAAFGVMLFRRGATGHCHTYDLLGVSTARESDMLDSRHDADAADRLAHHLP